MQYSLAVPQFPPPPPPVGDSVFTCLLHATISSELKNHHYSLLKKKQTDCLHTVVDVSLYYEDSFCQRQ
jgi:hypothetical protein